jgi:hypothetical protein
MRCWRFGLGGWVSRSVWRLLVFWVGVEVSASLVVNTASGVPVEPAMGLAWVMWGVIALCSFGLLEVLKCVCWSVVVFLSVCGVGRGWPVDCGGGINW